MRKVSLFLVVLILVGTPVLAVEGPYAGLGLGSTKVDDTDVDLVFSDSAMGWKVFGGYAFTDMFAMEFSYFESGTASDSLFGEKIDVEVTGYTLVGRGSLALGDRLGVFLKGGFFSNDTDATVLGVTLSEDDSGLTLGAGLRYQSTDRIAIRGEFDWFDADIDTLWTVSVGLEFSL
ncbi:MAG: porin family protein [Acidobacteriota bacterium]|nr:porin family protein [Acidobacteriota bacterium]